MSPTVVRPMGEKDLPRVYEIDVLSSGLPWTERSYRFELTQNPNARLWVAETVSEGIEPQVVAFLIIWIIVDETHIANVAVHPDYRRRGIGLKLLKTGVESSWQEEAQIAYLEVRRGNQGAQALYRKMGFIEVGIRRHYYHDTHEDAILMNLTRQAYEEHCKNPSAGQE